MDGSGENEKRKKKVCKKKEEIKLCREEIGVTEELKIVRLMLSLKVLYAGISV